MAELLLKSLSCNDKILQNLPVGIIMKINSYLFPNIDDTEADEKYGWDDV